MTLKSRIKAAEVTYQLKITIAISIDLLTLHEYPTSPTFVWCAIAFCELLVAMVMESVAK